MWRYLHWRWHSSESDSVLYDTARSQLKNGGGGTNSALAKTEWSQTLPPLTQRKVRLSANYCNTAWSRLFMLLPDVSEKLCTWHWQTHRKIFPAYNLPVWRPLLACKGMYIKNRLNINKPTLKFFNNLFLGLLMKRILLRTD